MANYNEEMTSDNTKTFEMAMTLIGTNKAVPKEFQDEFSVYEMIAENNKLEELNGLTVQPLVIFYNEESFKNEDTGETETELKTYMLAQHEDGSVKMYNGFSLTFRLKIELLQGVFKTKLPKISVSKVSKGMKQEYVIKPIKE